MCINKSCRNSRAPAALPSRLLSYLIAALVVAVVAESAFAEITKGPVLLRVEQNRAALMWETDTRGPGKLSYGRGRRFEKYITTTPEKVKYRVQKNTLLLRRKKSDTKYAEAASSLLNKLLTFTSFTAAPKLVEYKTQRGRVKKDKVQKGSKPAVKGDVYIHKLWLEDLKPNQLYSYL